MPWIGGRLRWQGRHSSTSSSKIALGYPGLPSVDGESLLLESASAARTERIAAACAQILEPGDVVLVAGELGVGKTTFVRGACRALGVAGPVTSPTYVIGQVYEGTPPVAHVDLYRLETLATEDPALLDDYLTPERIGFIEWPNLVADAPDWLAKVRLQVEIEFADGGKGDDRRIGMAGDRRTLRSIGEALS